MNSDSLSISQLAKLLSAASGKRITIEMIRKDVDDGAPVNGDGTVNLFHYGAWLANELE
jgi:hypothetical protein